MQILYTILIEREGIFVLLKIHVTLQGKNDQVEAKKSRSHLNK